MKIKTKLIATIVSMCASLAVMAVGVWAAVTNFTLQITNNVQLTFASAEVVITGQGSTTGLTLGTTSIAEMQLFNNGAYTKNSTGADSEQVAVGTNAYDFQQIADTWDINATTLGKTGTDDRFDTPATITYTYTITPSATTSYSRDVNLLISETATPPSYKVNGVDVFVVSYTYTLYKNNNIYTITSGDESVEQKDLKITPGTPVLLDFSNNSEAGTIDECVVTCKLEFKGTTASINVNASWNYSISVANVDTQAQG